MGAAVDGGGICEWLMAARTVNGGTVRGDDGLGLGRGGGDQDNDTLGKEENQPFSYSNCST